MGSELPDGARVPEDVPWIMPGNGGPFFEATRADWHQCMGDPPEMYSELLSWENLKPWERAYAAARCWAWWQNEADEWDVACKGTTEAKAKEAECLEQVSIWRDVWRVLHGFDVWRG